MTKKRALITARAFWTSGQEAEAALNAAGFTTAYSPEAGPYSAERLAPLLQNYEASVCSSDQYNAALFEACPDLAVVSRCGVGIDSVDLAAATAAGVLVTNTPGAMTDAVADYTFALLLSVARRVAESHATMLSGGWGDYTGVLVCGKTLGLVGFGQIGQGVARRAAGFGMKILAHDPDNCRAKQRCRRDCRPITFVELDELLAQSDFVSVHAPSLPETKHLFNGARLAQMKPTAYLINTARGALDGRRPRWLHALETNQIAGAALDVLR